MLNELLKLSNSNLYHALYDIYDRGSCEAVEQFEKWMAESNENDAMRIRTALDCICENEAVFNSMF